MADKAKDSIDRLFNEPFTPAWQTQQRQAKEELARDQWEKWKKLVNERAELRWRVEAEKSHQRIMKNCKGVWRVA
jgi:hypothetical protein